MGQLFFAHFITLAQLADRVILAEETSKVAVSEEYSTRTMSTHQGGFLAEVRAVAGHECFAGGAAPADVASRPVDTTIVRAHRATLEQGQSPCHALPQFAATVKL
jgi:hypothetical protein